MGSILNAVKNLFKGSGKKDMVVFTNEDGLPERGEVIQRKGSRRPRVVVRCANGKKIVLREGQFT